MVEEDFGNQQAEESEADTDEKRISP